MSTHQPCWYIHSINIYALSAITIWISLSITRAKSSVNDLSNVDKMIENSDSDRTTLESLWLVTDFVQSNNIHQIGELSRISLVIFLYLLYKWATTWQNQQNECVPSEDSD